MRLLVVDRLHMISRSCGQQVPIADTHSDGSQGTTGLETRQLPPALLGAWPIANKF